MCIKYYMKVEKITSSCFEWYFDSKTEELKTNRTHNHPKNYYTLRYFYNPNKTFFHLYLNLCYYRIIYKYLIGYNLHVYNIQHT